MCAYVCVCAVCVFRLKIIKVAVLFYSLPHSLCATFIYHVISQSCCQLQWLFWVIMRQPHCASNGEKGLAVPIVILLKGKTFFGSFVYILTNHSCLGGTKPRMQQRCTLFWWNTVGDVRGQGRLELKRAPHVSGGHKCAESQVVFVVKRGHLGTFCPLLGHPRTCLGPYC